jgi:hypothetical protein
MDADELGDLDVACHLVETMESAELFLYPALQAYCHSASVGRR